MENRVSGFTVVEAIVGATILFGVLLAGTMALRPVQQSYRKLNLVSAMSKIEDEIRRGIFYQQNYTTLSTLQIKYGNVVVAQNGKTMYVSDALDASSTSPIYPIQTRFEVDNYISPSDHTAHVGGLYQVSVDSRYAIMHPFGIDTWPTAALTTCPGSTYKPSPGSTPVNAILQCSATDAFNSSYASAVIEVPTSYANQSYQPCTNGFVRGITGAGQVVCWSYQQTTCGAWSIPYGYSMSDASGAINVNCQKLNTLSCPPLTIPLTTGGAPVTLNNFSVLATLQLSDLYPPVSAQTNGQSVCTPIVNFSVYSTSGLISAAIVSQRSPASLPNSCPDARLYTQNADKSCTPNFNAALIPQSIPAEVSAP